MTFIQWQEVSWREKVVPKQTGFIFGVQGVLAGVGFLSELIFDRTGKSFHIQTYLYPFCRRVKKFRPCKDLWVKYGDRIWEDFLFPYPQGHPIFLSFFSWGSFFFGWSDTTSFSLEVVPSQSVSGAPARRRLNAVQAHFSVSWAVLA